MCVCACIVKLQKGGKKINVGGATLVFQSMCACLWLEKLENACCHML